MNSPELRRQGDEKVTLHLRCALPMSHGLPGIPVEMEPTMELSNSMESGDGRGFFFAPGELTAVVQSENDHVQAFTANGDAMTERYLEETAAMGFSMLAARAAGNHHYPPDLDGARFGEFGSVVHRMSSWWSTTVQCRFGLTGEWADILSPEDLEGMDGWEGRIFLPECSVSVTVSDLWDSPQVSYQAFWQHEYWDRFQQRVVSEGESSTILRAGGPNSDPATGVPDWALSGEVTHRAKWLHREFGRKEHLSAYAFADWEAYGDDPFGEMDPLSN